MSINCGSFTSYYNSELPRQANEAFTLAYWTYVRSDTAGLTGDGFLFSESPSLTATNSFFIAASIHNGSGIVYGGFAPTAGANDGGEFTMYTDRVREGWNSLVFVNYSSGVRSVFVNGYEKQQSGVTVFFEPLEHIRINGVSYSNNTKQNAEFSWWDKALTLSEVQLYSSGYPASIIATENLFFYCPCLGEGMPHDIMGNINPFTEVYPSTPSSGHPNIFSLSKAIYPQQVNNGSLYLFLKCGGDSEGCYPYDSGNGNFSSAFSTAFNRQICGSPPGWHMNMYMDARQISSGTIDGYIYGQSPNSGSVTAFLKVIDTFPETPYGTGLASMNMFLQGQISQSDSGNMSMFMWANNSSGLYNIFPMFLRGDFESGVYNSSFNLVVNNNLSDSYTSSLNMMLKAAGNSDGSTTITNEFPITLYNDYVAYSGLMDMYLSGPSGTDGAIPFSGNMNLVMWRQIDSTANNMPLYMSGPDGNNSGLNLYLEGQPRPTGAITMYLDGGNESSTGSIKLYTHGF